MQQTNLFQQAKEVEEIDFDALEPMLEPDDIIEGAPEVVKEEFDDADDKDIDDLLDAQAGDEEEEDDEIDAFDDEEEQEEESEEEQEEKSEARKAIEVISEKYGLDYELPEDIDDISLTASIIATMAEEIKELKSKTVQISENPLVQSFSKFVEKGGDVKEFYDTLKKATDVKLQQLEALKEYTPSEIIFADYIQQGYSEDEADALIVELEEKGIVDFEYKKVFKKYERLIESETLDATKNFLTKEVEDIEQEEAQSKEIVEQAKAELATTLSKIASVDGYKLTEQDKEEVFEFITSPDEEGLTPLDRWLQSNENLLFTGIMAKKAKDIFQFQKTFHKNQGKKELFNTLNKAPVATKKKGFETAKSFDSMVSEINKI